MTSYTFYVGPKYMNFIAPFDHDLVTTKNGTIYYRLVNATQDLSQIGLEISSLYYLNTLYFLPTNALITTWDSVAPWDVSIKGFASFQAILSTDGLKSFLTVNYGTLNFSASGGYYFRYGPSNNYTSISKSRPESSSNVGVSGKWIFPLSIFVVVNQFCLNSIFFLLLLAKIPDIITTTSTKTTSTTSITSTNTITTTSTTTRSSTSSAEATSATKFEQSTVVDLLTNQKETSTTLHITNTLNASDEITTAPATISHAITSLTTYEESMFDLSLTSHKIGDTALGSHFLSKI